MYAAEVLEGAGDVDALYQQLKDYFTFFDAAALRDSGTVSWAYNPSPRLDTAYKYPIPIAWMTDVDADMGGLEDGIWWRYAPGNDPASPTFVAIAAQLAVEGDSAAMLDSLVNDYVAATSEGFTLIDTRTFNSDNDLLWDVALFTITRNGQEIVGRMYTTVINDMAYAIWVETPNSDSAAVTFANTFELIVNGFQFQQ